MRKRLKQLFWSCCMDEEPVEEKQPLIAAKVEPAAALQKNRYYNNIFDDPNRYNTDPAEWSHTPSTGPQHETESNPS